MQSRTWLTLSFHVGKKVASEVVPVVVEFRMGVSAASSMKWRKLAPINSMGT